MRSFDIETRSIYEILNSFDFNIPDYQRRYRWKPKNRESLIESLLGGFPIGALTLYIDDKDNKKYFIIDGVQRINTLKLYLSSPNQIINYKLYYISIEKNIDFFQEKYPFFTKNQYKKIIQKWYNSLLKLFEYTKLSVLRSSFSKNEVSKIPNNIEFEFYEELLDVLKKPIDLRDYDVALIYYSGNKDDLPQLFKNINTGSIALSEYELYQAIWINYRLNANVFTDYKIYYQYQIEKLSESYEIDNTIVEINDFDIFKALTALSNRIRTINNLDSLFSDLKKMEKPDKIKGSEISIIYEKDNIGFELLSVLFSMKPNGVNTAVENIFDRLNNTNRNELNQFILVLLDNIYISTVKLSEIVSSYNLEYKLTRYHSLYIYTAFFYSKYYVDLYTLTFIERNSLDLEEYYGKDKILSRIRDDWFVKDNRQLSWFINKISDLYQFWRL
jgi:uncharacterized protein with ParB-like and HNH nuclease domain